MASLTLDKVAATGTATIIERREMGVLNIGETGTVSVGGEDHALEHGEVLYIGMGAGPVTFAGGGRFLVLSAPTQDLPHHPDQAR